MNFTEIKGKIIDKIRKGNKNFIIYPYGEIGQEVCRMLKESFGITPIYVIDKELCEYNPNISSPDILGEIDCTRYILILTCLNTKVYRVIYDYVSLFLTRQIL